jgi:filamentous hemagglutinin
MVDTNARQQEEIQAFCASSPEQCQKKYGHLLDEMDASIALIKKLDIDKALPNKFGNYLNAIYMLNNEAGSVVVEDGGAKRIESMGLDKETAELVASELPSLGGTLGGKKSGNSKVSVRSEMNNKQI